MVNFSFLFLDKSVNTKLLFDLVLILLEKPKEDHFALTNHHFVDVLDCLSELPVLVAVLHEFVEEFELDFLLVTHYLLQNVHEFALLQLVLLLVQNFLDVLIFVEQIVVAELTASYLVPDGLLKHGETFFEDLHEGEVLVKGLLALYHVDDAEYDFALLLSQSPDIESSLGFALEVAGHF